MRSERKLGLQMLRIPHRGIEIYLGFFGFKVRVAYMLVVKAKEAWRVSKDVFSDIFIRPARLISN